MDGHGDTGSLDSVGKPTHSMSVELPKRSWRRAYRRNFPTHHNRLHTTEENVINQYKPVITAGATATAEIVTFVLYILRIPS